MRSAPLPLSSPRRRLVRVEVLGGMSPGIRAALDHVAERIELADEHATAPPDLVLVRIAHPDDPQLGDLAVIVSRRPGARLLVIGGEWCASALRTRRFDCGGLWTDEARLPIRLRLEIAALSGGPAADLLPATADRTEVFEAESSDLIPLPPCRVAVDSPDAVFLELCRDELTSRGATVIVGDGKSGAAVDTLVVDVDPLGDRHPCLQEPAPRCPLLILTTTHWALRDIPLSFPHRVVAKLAGGGEWARALSALVSRSS